MILEGSVITPGMTVSTALGIIVLPVIGWLVTNGIKLLKSYTMIDAKVRDNCDSIKSLEKSHATTDARITKVEEAIHAIKDAAQRKDEQFLLITTKLDQLPALATMMNVLTQSATSIVPRSEVENRMKAAEERLGMLERDVRDRRAA